MHVCPLCHSIAWVALAPGFNHCCECNHTFGQPAKIVGLGKGKA